MYVKLESFDGKRMVGRIGEHAISYTVAGLKEAATTKINPIRVNVDDMPIAEQQQFLNTFFHSDNIFIVTDKDENDPETVTIPDDPNNTLIGTAPTQDEIANAPVKVATANTSANATANTSANEKQIDGDHYKAQQIEPWDYINANNLSFMQGNIIKYVTRLYLKNPDPLVDLRKIQHYVDKMIEVETAKQQQQQQ